MIDLKPCPFCGYTSVNMIGHPKAVYFVSCKKCGAEGPICQTLEAAANLWNECRGREVKKKMSKCTPVYLMCHYEPDEGSSIEPMPLTIDYKKIESDDLNEKIADLIKDFEKEYLEKVKEND